MNEVAFAQSFLSLLDSKPTKISADHVEDPRSYPARPPYILPKLPKPMSRPSKRGAASTSAPGSEASLTVTLKSLRNPPLDIRLTSQPPNTSILDLKSAVSTQTGLPIEKIKVLLNKKPVADSKVLKELVSADANAVEFSVMVLGGGVVKPQASGSTPTPSPHPHSAEHGPVAQGLSGEDVVKTQEFWRDLEGFLQQRVRDEETATGLMGVFKEAWEKR